MEKLVEGYPSHGFVIDHEEARKIFTKVEALQGAERDIALIFRSALRHFSREPMIVDVGTTYRAKPGERANVAAPKRTRGSQNLSKGNGSSQTSSAGPRSTGAGAKSAAKSGRGRGKGAIAARSGKAGSRRSLRANGLGHP